MSRNFNAHVLPKLSRPILYGLLVISFGWFAATAVAAPGRPWGPSSHHPAPRNVALTRIESVLRDRMPDQALPEKAKTKLLGLSDWQFSIAASLTERIEEEGHSAAGELAFLVLTTLLILS